MQLSRGDFIRAALGTTAGLLTACGAETTRPDDGGGTLGEGTGGGASGGVSASGGAGTSSGGAASGGTSSGGASSEACSADIETLSSLTAPGLNQHQHVLRLSLAVLTAGQEVTLQTSNLEGDPGASHCHQVTLTSEDLATIRGGGTVKSSC
jgi:hypothetical protein